MTTGTAIEFSPLLSWAVLGPLFALTALVLAVAALRRARGTAWRLLAATALALALLNPAVVREQREPIRDVAVVVLDESPSQAIGDRRERAEAALEGIRERLAGRDDMELRIVRAGGEDGTSGETRLFEALERAVADVPRRRMAGAVLITDGQVHDVPDGLGGLDGAGPIHTLLTGTRDEGDRRLAIVQAPSFGLVGKEVSVTLRVDDLPGGGEDAGSDGGNGGGEAVLTVRQDGGEPRGYRVRTGAEQTLTFTLGHGGQNVIEFEVQAASEELTLANNRAAVVVNGVRDRLRVLLVSGEPHAGERTWRNLLKADPGVDLVHFTILRPPEKQDGTPIRELSLIAFPIRELFELKLDEFDLIIFDRYQRRGILPQLYLANIADFVRRGGGLLEAGGPSFSTSLSLYRTPLGEVLPGEPTGDTIEEGFRPGVTSLGRRHPVTAGLPGDAAEGEPDWGRWFRQIDAQPRSGSVVMEGVGGRPLLILDRVGEGRVAQLMSDHIWLWSRGFEGGGPQAELLRRLAHWLMKEPELEENDLRARVDGNRITVERRRLEPDEAEVELTTPSGRTEPLSLTEDETGLASTSIAAEEPGIYRISDGERTALAVVGAVNSPEFSDMRTTPDNLAPTAEASGGGVLWLADQSGGPGAVEVRRTDPERDQSGRNWIGLRANGDYIVTGVSDMPLLPAGLVLLLVLGALMAAWRREGR